jgi:transcriptional regulator with XRE-family HTH domain
MTLREARERRGLSLRRLEEEIGTHRGMLSQVERGERRIPHGIAGAWARALGLSTRELFALSAEARFEREREVAALVIARAIETKGTR